MSPNRAKKVFPYLFPVAVILSFAVNTAFAAGDGPPQQPQLRIMDADIDLDSRTLTVRGRNFINGYWPELKVGDQALRAVSVSVEAIVAEAPEGLKSGKYLLSLSTGSSGYQNDAYLLTVGNAADRGPQDAEGGGSAAPRGLQDGSVQSAMPLPACIPGQVLLQRNGTWQCGTLAPFPNAIATCLKNDCALSRCGRGFGDCDRMVENGCETMMLSDRRNCGGCGTVCENSPCIGGRCQEPTCTDGFKNGRETDVDCGGDICGRCDIARSCNSGPDCTSSICTNGSCQPPACTDGVRNGEETDKDCGGGMCAKCDIGLACGSAGDCTSALCIDGVCQAPTCRDGVRNGSETDIDCGGDACPQCIAGRTCDQPGDCASSVCTNQVCQAPLCSDGVRNGSETDVDCGGGTCTACADTLRCGAHRDCLSGVCAERLCVSPDADSDADGVLDIYDTCPRAPDPGQLDSDGDGRGDRCDNCPAVSNPDQSDGNNDGIGDACG